MAAGNNGGVVIPLRKNAFVHHQGQEYQIVKFLRATTTSRDERDTEDGLIYKVWDPRTNSVVDITLPIHIQPQLEEGEEDDYFQILELNEDLKEVTLKSFLTGDERKMKVRWDDDLELIRDGLMEEKKELFCTLGSIVGKEVMGDFKFMPKGPPIMKMPDEILDMILSKCTPQDRLTCRLVTSRWTSLLPINKFVKCINLGIHLGGPTPVYVEFDRLDIPNFTSIYGHRHISRDMDIKDAQLLINAFLLKEIMEYVVVYPVTESRMEHLLPTFPQHCSRFPKFIFRDVPQTEDDSESNWGWAKKIISADKGHLQQLHVETFLRVLDLSETQIGECIFLQQLIITLSQKHSVILNLESLPPSLTELHINRLAVPLKKSQLLWISTNLTQLNRVSLDVHHNHSDGDTSSDDLDEVDEDTISQMLNNLSSLKSLCLYLGTPIEEGEEEGCGRGKHLGNQKWPRFDTFFVTDESTVVHQGTFELLNCERMENFS